MSASAPSVLASRCPAGSFSLFGDANVLTGDVFSVSSRAILCSSARTGSPKHKPRHRASRTPELFGRARAPHKGGWTCVALGTVLRCTLGGSARPWSGDTRPALPAVSYLGSYKPPRCLRRGRMLESKLSVWRAILWYMPDKSDLHSSCSSSKELGSKSWHRSEEHNTLYSVAACLRTLSTRLQSL